VVLQEVAVKAEEFSENARCCSHTDLGLFFPIKGWEGEAPAEPICGFGRSLTLPVWDI